MKQPSFIAFKYKGRFSWNQWWEEEEENVLAKISETHLTRTHLLYSRFTNFAPFFWNHHRARTEKAVIPFFIFRTWEFLKDLAALVVEAMMIFEELCSSNLGFINFVSDLLFYLPIIIQKTCLINQLLQCMFTGTTQKAGFRGTLFPLYHFTTHDVIHFCFSEQRKNGLH